MKSAAGGMASPRRGVWNYSEAVYVINPKMSTTTYDAMRFQRFHPPFRWLHTNPSDWIKNPECIRIRDFLEVPPRFELGIRELQSHALPLGYGTVWSGLRGSNSLPPPWQGGALPDELNPHIKWCLRSESNQRHEDFQSSALPTELQRQMATWMGLEPTTSSVTG